MGRFINADVLVSTGQGILGNNMFAYCRNNPINRVDCDGFKDEQSTEEETNEETEENKNIYNMLAFFGVSSVDDLPTLDENCMVFIENYKAVSLGQVTIVYGRTIVMDRNKYCEYFFVGTTSSKSIIPIPLDGGITKGYVYNVNTPEDYCGIFVSPSANMMVDVSGVAVAPNGVYATIISGLSFNASIGINITYYSMVSDGWIYDKADIQWIDSRSLPFTYPNDTSPIYV